MNVRLRRLIQLIEVGLVKVVMVDSLIRISRDVNQIMSFGSLIEKHNAKVIVLDGAEVYRIKIYLETTNKRITMKTGNLSYFLA
ncbi:recombinase family protein [Bacillus mesophilus]|nr:recombinase family protein [Bacillus mesophilus]